MNILHAAAAFGLAFLIAPSGMISRLISPELTGWTRPPDLLIVNDPAGIAMMAGLVMKEIPFLFLTGCRFLSEAEIGYGKKLGVGGYLIKPISVNDLLSAIKNKL